MRIESNMAQTVEKIDQLGRYPYFVKPANLGSSVGISKVHHAAELNAALTLAAEYDRRVLVEVGINAREIEVSVLGNQDVAASLPGEIIPTDEFYSYNAKYLDGTSRLLIPAPLTQAQSDQIREFAMRAYRAADCAGLARVDFLLDKDSGEIFISEINTMPGFTRISMYPKLWEASGVAYPELVEKLLALAVERKAEPRAHTLLLWGAGMKLNQTRNISPADAARERRNQKSAPRSKLVARQVTASTSMARPQIVMRSSSGVLTAAPRTQPKASARRQTYYKVGEHTELRMPALPVIKVGYRLVSGILFAGMTTILILLLASPTFQVKGLGLAGNKRINKADVVAALNLENKSIFTVDPEAIASELSVKFPEFTDVRISFGLPAEINIAVRERKPVAWPGKRTAKVFLVGRRRRGHASTG